LDFVSAGAFFAVAFFRGAAAVREMAQPLRERHRTTLGTGAVAHASVEQRTVVGLALGDHQSIDVDVLVQARVGDGGAHDLEVEGRAALRRKLQQFERLVHRATADEVGDVARLAGGDAREAMSG
jgi:hypothetical protein